MGLSGPRRHTDGTRLRRQPRIRWICETCKVFVADFLSDVLYTGPFPFSRVIGMAPPAVGFLNHSWRDPYTPGHCRSTRPIQRPMNLREGARSPHHPRLSGWTNCTWHDDPQMERWNERLARSWPCAGRGPAPPNNPIRQRHSDWTKEACRSSAPRTRFRTGLATASRRCDLIVAANHAPRWGAGRG